MLCVLVIICIVYCYMFLYQLKQINLNHLIVKGKHKHTPISSTFNSAIINHKHRSGEYISFGVGEVLVSMAKKPLGPISNHQGTYIAAPTIQLQGVLSLPHPSSHSSRTHPILCPRYTSHIASNSSLNLTLAPHSIRYSKTIIASSLHQFQLPLSHHKLL